MRPVLILLFSSIFLLFLPASCRKDHNTPDPTPPPPPKPTVFVFGSEGNNALLWKNDTASKVNGLPVGNFEFKTSTMALSNGQVYIAGGQVYFNGVLQVFKPMYWLNGTATTLPDSSGDAACQAVFVSGADVYVAGTTYYKDTSHVPYTTPTADYPLSGTRATLWKNGKPVSLPGYGVLGLVDSGRYITRGFSDYVNSIYVSGNDVYVSGGSYNTLAHAAYWKNGARVDLTVSGGLPTTTSLFVSGSDVYVTGFKSSGGLNTDAVYWKNGVPYDIKMDFFGSSSAHSVFVAGSDVYIAGWQIVNGYRRAVLWKNGTAAFLTDGRTSSSATSVYVSGSDVYVAGYQWVAPNPYRAVYWKNGKADTLTDGSVSAIAYSIKVE